MPKIIYIWCIYGIFGRGITKYTVIYGAYTVHFYRVGQNRIYIPYINVYLVISLPKIPYIHHKSIQFWPTLHIYGQPYS